MSMLKASVALNESTGENDSLLLHQSSTPSLSSSSSSLPSSSTRVADGNQIESISVSNMEETSANVNTDDSDKSSKSNNCQNENKSNVSNVEETTTTSTKHTRNNDTINNDAIKTTPTRTTTSTSQSPSSSSVASDSDSSANQAAAARKKVVQLLIAPNVETICDDISSTTEDIKRLKHVQVRSNSTGKLYQSSRRVSFPENDSELVTGYLEPADPWAYG